MKIKKGTGRIRAVLAVTLALLPGATAASAQELPWGDEPWPPAAGAPGADSESQAGTDGAAQAAVRLYGSLTTSTQSVFPHSPNSGESLEVGASSDLRLKGEWKPSDSVRIYVEGAVTYAVGRSNELSWMQSAGLDGGTLVVSQLSEISPDHRLSVDLIQAWAQLSFPLLDLQVGSIPIAWGTGYAFNPTMKTHPVDSLSTGSIRSGTGELSTPGTVAVSVSIPIGQVVSLETYLAFEDRTHTGFALGEDTDIRNYPWGARLRTALGPFDFSLGAVKEVVYPDAAAIAAAVQSSAPIPSPQRRLFGTGDLVVNIADASVYAEAAVLLPAWDAPTGEPFGRRIESTVGIDYTLPGDINAKLEYYRNGSGRANPSAYDLADLQAASSPLLGIDYLFGYLGHTFVDYLEVTGIVLVNLRDGSSIVVPGISYSFSDELTVAALGIIPFGREGTEFVGPVPFAGAGSVRTVRPSVLLQVEVLF